MNYGHVADGGGEPLLLSAEDEPDRYCIQLYERVATPAKLAGAKVLEVGCGRGGGASFLSRYHGPEKFTGADFSAELVQNLFLEGGSRACALWFHESFISRMT